MMKLFSLLLLFFGLVSCAESQVNENSQDLVTYADAILLDVRTPGEFQQGSPAGAINVPVDNISSNQGLLPENKDAKIVVFCLSGGRSSHAKHLLEEMGYTNIIDGKTHKLVGKKLQEESAN